MPPDHFNSSRNLRFSLLFPWASPTLNFELTFFKFTAYLLKRSKFQTREKSELRFYCFPKGYQYTYRKTARIARIFLLAPSPRLSTALFMSPSLHISLHVLHLSNKFSYFVISRMHYHFKSKTGFA